MLITRIRPSLWVCFFVAGKSAQSNDLNQQIPIMEVIWSALTMVLASAKNFNTLIAVRFFVGVFLISSIVLL